MNQRALLVALALTTLPGCRVVEGIFKAGFWVGAIVIVMVVALVFGAVRLVGR
jgi:hypothetical protein